MQGARQHLARSCLVQDVHLSIGMQCLLGVGAVACLSMLALPCCGGDFPEPQTTAHANHDFVPVPYLPPAALVEVAGEPPDDACVWFDGHWVWRGDEYVWKRGGWVTSHPDLYYAPWKTLILPDGRLMFAEGRWLNGAGHRVTPPDIVRAARTPPNEVTSEFESPR